MFAASAKKHKNIVTIIIELNVLFIIEIMTGLTVTPPYESSWKLKVD